MKPEDITYIEKQLGYTFKNKNLLIQSLTRKAFALEQKQRGINCEDQEIYIILGDAVLKLILVEILIDKGYESRETITTKKSQIESRDNLGLMMQKMELARFIRLGLGEQVQNISKHPSVLGETLEALIAAIYIDEGCYEKTKLIIGNLFKSVFEPMSTKEDTEVDIMAEIWMRYNTCDSSR
jgi:ribonuclease III